MSNESKKDFNAMMKNNLRADGYFLSAINNKIENKISPVELIRVNRR